MNQVRLTLQETEDKLQKTAEQIDEMKHSHGKAHGKDKKLEKEKEKDKDAKKSKKEKDKSNRTTKLGLKDQEDPLDDEEKDVMEEKVKTDEKEVTKLEIQKPEKTALKEKEKDKKKKDKYKESRKSPDSSSSPGKYGSKSLKDKLTALSSFTHAVSMDTFSIGQMKIIESIIDKKFSSFSQIDQQV